MAENDTSPERQAYEAATSEGYEGRLATNIANIRLFKDNPYIRDLSEADKVELNKKLLKPYDGELFYDDDKFKWICYYSIDPATGSIKYNYISKEKELQEKLEYYETKGVMNQLLSAYNNGQIYKFYFDRSTNMMYPNTSLIFPTEFDSYTISKQELNDNNAKVYVAGILEDANSLDYRIGMKTIVDSAAGTTYKRMVPANIFPNTNAEKQYAQVVNTEFYVVEFFNADGIVIDKKLFQAVESTAINTQIPSASVVDLQINVIRNSIPEKSANNIYPILAGEDLTKTVSFTVSAIYSDGTPKLITDKLDTAQLTRTGWDVDTTGAEIGKQFTVEFTYWPTISEDGEPIGSSITREIIFQVVANNYEKLYKVIPVMWSENNNDFQVDSTSSNKIYALKVYTLSNDGILENRTRAVYSTLKKVDETETGSTLVKFEDAAYTYDPYRGVINFVFDEGNLGTDTKLSFQIYSDSVATEFRIKVHFGKDANSVNGLFVTTTGDTSNYGYDPTSGQLRTLLDTFNAKNTARLVYSADNSYMFTLTSEDVDFYNRYSRSKNGTIFRPNRVQLYAVKDTTSTPITSLMQFAKTATVLQLPTIKDTGVFEIVRNLKTYDYILAKYIYVEGSTSMTTDIDVYNINKDSAVA